ncbi:MAG: hypothetical protein JNM78_03335 [Cyclobacteriaceae bacterium]|nr:hypothetical protein [Cyclobacteriaceae bacterium]
MKSRIKAITKVIIALEAMAFFILLYTFFLMPIVSFILIVLILYDLRSRADMLIISADGIIIRNWLTFEKRRYSYDDFDRVVMHMDPLEQFGRYNLYFLKRDIIFNKIAGRNFSNLDEMIIEIERRKMENDRN